MKTTTKAAVLLLTIAMSGASQGALAACDYETGTVTQAITDATFYSKKNPGKDQTNMLVKVQAAISKINEEKYSDAIGKLIDISDKANALADAPKPKLEDASGINAAVLAATVCINGL
jgi:hypothetical protein